MPFTHSELVRNHHKFAYDTDRYNFTEILKKIFDDWSGPIETLHEFFHGSDTLEQITIDNDTKTAFHQKYYKSEHYDQMVSLYHNFVKDCVIPLFDCDDTVFVIQKEPTFRINLPNNSALGVRPTMQDPTDRIGIHCDADYNHPDGEINFMLTFGKQFGTNSCYVETAPGSDEFYPIEMNYGEFFSFYGNKCRHFNKKNDTGMSRVSIDFRVMPISKYNEECNKKSLHSDRPFLIGGYYTIISR